MADNLTTFICRLSCNLLASATWNPLGLSSPVQGLLYLYILFIGLNQYVRVVNSMSKSLSCDTWEYMTYSAAKQLSIL